MELDGAPTVFWDGDQIGMKSFGAAQGQCKPAVPNRKPRVTTP